MKNLFLTKTRWLVTIILLTALGIGNAWGEEITYTFSSKSWAASPANWTSNTDGSSFESSGSARGVANNGVNGACTSPITFANVSSISIVASSNKTGGKVAIKIGDTQIANKSIAKSDNATYTYNSSDYPSIANLSGNVQIVVTKPTSKSVWVKSITITYSAAPAYTVGWTIDPAEGGTLSTTSGTSTTVTPNSAYTYGAPAYTVTTGSATVSQNTNTFTATPTSDCTIRINMIEKPKYTVTFHNAAGSAPSPVTQASAGAEVSIPSADACDGWTFVGWKIGSAQSSTTSDPTGSGYITSASYTPTGNIDAYAVFSKTEGGGGAVVDEMTPSAISNPSSYEDWSGKSLTSSAVYAGQTTGGNNYIQMRTTNSNSGIVMTTSGGNVTHIEVTWNSTTTSGRTLNIYGKNSAYEYASDLYDVKKQGTLIGSIKYETSTELNIDDDYAYIGVRSSSSALYLDQIDFTIGGGGTTTWRSDPPCSSATLDHIAISTPPTTTNYLVGQVFSSAGAVVTAYYDDDSHREVTASWTPTTPLTAGTGQTATASYTEGGVTKTATTTINVYAVTLLKKDETGVTISSDPPTVSCSVAALSASETGNKYTFKEWQISGASLDDASSLTPNIINVTGAVTVTAVYYKPITVTWHVPSGVFSGPSTYSRGWSAILPASNPDPGEYGCDGKVFYGWSRTSDYSSDDTAPTDIVESGDALTTDEHFYAVFADKEGEGTAPEWTKTALGSVTAGTYLICTTNGKPFNGTISSGHGQPTTGAFSSANWALEVFNEDAPIEAKEITFSTNGSGWKMYVEGSGYLYATKASSGGFSYQNDAGEEYWSAASSAWKYSKNYSGNNAYLRVYSSTFRTYNSSNGGDAGIVLLKKTAAGSPATYSKFSTSCSCEGFSFHTGTGTDESVKTTNTRLCFTQVDASTTWKIDNYTIPSATKFFVGWQDEFVNSLGTSSRSSVQTWAAEMYFEYSKNYGDGWRKTVGAATGAVGTLRIWSDNSWNNCHVGFDPNGYIFKLGSTNLEMHDATSGLDGAQYKETDVVTLTSSDISSNYQVNLYTGSAGGVACDNSVSKAMTTMGVKSGSGDSWRGTSVDAGTDTNTKGFFRIDLAQTHTDTKNWNAHWVPCYELTFNLKGGSGTIATTPAYVSCEGDAAARTVTIPNTAPTKSGYRFMGWSDTDGGGVNYAAGSTHNVTLSENKTVYAVWKQEFTVTYAYAGGSGSCAGGSYIEGETVTVCASTPTKDGSTFKGWSYSPSVTVTAGTFPMPASNVTVTATWQDTEYTLTHYGNNYTNTEGRTRIKSGDTPLTLNYTCTGTYGFPSDVTISGGGKGTWTKDTHYTWTVAGNKQSARLVINETTITADVAITITMSTLYTVTFVHHSKGTYSDGSTEWSVRSDENVITLPTVTDVSCGFYDTFEGWIASGSEYNESTSKPATVYAGGSSYTVTGNVTLRALYSKCEGAGGSVYRKVTAIGDVTDGTYILVSNNSTTPYVYSGHTDSKDYGNIVSGLTNDGDDYSSTLPSGAVPVTIAKGTETHSSHFTIKNGTKYFKAGTDIALQDTESWWQLTDGSKVNSKACPAGALQPVSATTYVMQEYNSNRFKTYQNTQSYYVFLYKLIDKCTKYYATNPSCVKPTGVHIVYNANTGDATMSCNNHNRTYKVQDEVNQYPKLASAYSFCTDATRDGYTLVGWNTQTNGLGTTYELGTNYSNLPVSGELDGENWVTLNLYAMWAPAVSFDLGNATSGTGVPAVVEADGGFMLPTPTNEQLGTIPCSYSFYGWSESSVVATTSKPALFMPGTKYTGVARTLYAVYRKSEGGVNPDLFSLSYMYNSTKYYVAAPTGITTAPSTWNNDKAAKFSASTNAEDAVAFGMKTNADYPEFKEIYWVYDGVEEEKAYLSYSSGANITFKNAEDTYYLKWTITGTTTLTFLHSEGRYLSGNGTEIGCPSSAGVISFTKEEASATTYTYATNPNCSTKATLTFVTNGGTLNYPDTYTSSNYEDLDVPTTVKLPTATFAGEWEFEGWRKGSAVPSQSEPVSGANFYEVTLNTTTYTADVAGETIFYAVYSKTINEKPFDPNNEGTYKLFAIMADGTKKYMPTWDGTRKTLSPVTNCAATGDYTITPGTGEHAGQYKITHGNYTLGVVGESDTQFKDVADTWWDIENSTSNKGTWRIKVHGSSTRCLALSGTGSFSNTIISGFVNNPSQPGYRDMEIGECIYTEYTSTPENIPYITITGSPVKITSTNSERVYAPTKLHIEAHNFSTTRTIHFDATNGFATNPASVTTGANGAYSGDIEIYYQPTTDGDGSIVSSVLTASQIAGPAAEKVSQTFSAIRGRNMPANFVIAAKVGEQWYAMPDDCRSSGTPAGVPIEVNDPNAPTAASLVPHNVEWRLSDVVNSNSRPKDKVYFYEPNSTNDYTLYAGAAPSIQTNAQLSNVTGGNSNNYEWGLTTTDLCAYTISNANVGKNISINTSGNFGTHAANIASSTLYLLPITAYYETAQMQVLEWKANSIVIMYTGTQTTATTKVGDNSASSAQTLSSQKLTHGIYELTTSQALTANAGQPLKVSFGGGAEIAIVTIPIIINSAVTANADHASEDVIIVSGGKLTAAATKYNFRNIYVYGGGKLKIASGSQLGVNNIILRAGGVTTNGSGGSATYAYVYPQVELGGTLSSTQTNIKYEYVTDYDHWYHLCLPFNATLTSIHYPQEYYGSNVRADNSGSWIIKRYDGATRATGDYNAWKDIENDSPAKTEVTAGVGYIFWGAPKKVIIGGDQQRQAWGIQRMTMSVAADAAKTAENADKNVSVAAHSGAGSVNDKGWNLVGNPYMVDLTAFSSDNLKQGQLVHSDAVPWDGKWKNDGTGTRYVTIPDNHFDTYEAKTTATASGAGDFMPGRVFFVQIEKGTTLTFEATNRAALAPAWHRNAEAEQPVDVETGIVMSSETLADEVNFWIKDGKTEAYEFNADYPKTPNKTSFNIYGVHQSGNLSWVAISPAIAEGDMAIGYQVPAAGDYTLSLSEKYIAEEIESVFVTDHGVSPELTTDLMVNTYTFTVHQAETNNERFTVSIKVREKNNTATDIGNSTADTHAVKFIRDDKMYILRNGLLYDATGKRVNWINK